MRGRRWKLSDARRSANVAEDLRWRRDLDQEQIFPGSRTAIGWRRRMAPVGYREWDDSVSGLQPRGRIPRYFIFGPAYDR
jgi:hypothetical protein